MIEHHRAVLGVQAAMYRRAVEPTPAMLDALAAAHGGEAAQAARPPLRSEPHAYDAMMADMDMLDRQILEAQEECVQALQNRRLQLNRVELKRVERDQRLN